MSGDDAARYISDDVQSVRSNEDPHFVRKLSMISRTTDATFAVLLRQIHGSMKDGGLLLSYTLKHGAQNESFRELSLCKINV
jgi:hypothetical protein